MLVTSDAIIEVCRDLNRANCRSSFEGTMERKNRGYSIVSKRVKKSQTAQKQNCKLLVLSLIFSILEYENRLNFHPMFELLLAIYTFLALLIIIPIVRLVRWLVVSAIRLVIWLVRTFFTLTGRLLLVAYRSIMN